MYVFDSKESSVIDLKTEIKYRRIARSNVPAAIKQ